jgi:hypothetical protein
MGEVFLAQDTRLGRKIEGGGDARRVGASPRKLIEKAKFGTGAN